MAVANNELQIVWSSANYKDLTTGAPSATSDLMALSGGTVDALVTVKADNQGAAADGDTVDLYALVSAGDADDDTTDDYPHDETDGDFLAQLDTYNMVSGDIAIATVRLKVGVGVKIYAISSAASNTIRVSAVVNEKVVS